MQYFTLYDLINSHAIKEGISGKEMLSYFRAHKISKKDLMAFSQTTALPDDEAVRSSIRGFLGMSDLEVSLALGNVPAEYRASFYDHISEIAGILSAEKRPDSKKLKPYFTNESGTLYHADCIETMRTIPAGSVDLIFADPPFNLNKEYDPGVDDDMTMSKYLNWTYAWLDECIRILKPGGRIFIYNLPKWCVYIASYLGQRLTFWDWIAIDMKATLPIQNRLYPAHYALVSYVKGTSASTFNNQRIPLQTCRHCGGEIKDYGGYKSKMNPAGVNVSDIWEDIYPVRHRNTKNRKFNELSVKLLDRVIDMSTNPGDLVFDPFGGSGTTYAVAQMEGRRWIGCEIGDCEIIKNRLVDDSKDREQLRRVREEKGHLFTKEARALRKKNRFWTTEE